MLNIHQFINNIASYFQSKIIIFNNEKILLKSNINIYNNKKNTLYYPKKEKRMELLSYSHPMIFTNLIMQSYVFIPIYKTNKKKQGVVWTFFNDNNRFCNIDETKLNLLITISEQICTSMNYEKIINKNKVYLGILECLQYNLDINLEIYSSEKSALINSNNQNNNNLINHISKNFYSNHNFIGGFKATCPNNILIKNKTINKNIFSQSKKYNKIIGKNPQINSVLNKISKVAKTNSTVLLRGESGTGKECFASMIHKESSRRNNPFVAINCAAIPEDLLESELFGYEKGAFTGANKKGKIGKIESANKGTLFLDEIGDMPLSLQVKLLRVLEERCIERIGSNNVIPVDIRIICATNKNIEHMISLGKFREDLFYRINVIPIMLPSLANRHDDIELLSYYYLKKYCILQNKNYKKFSYKALECLKNYNWPGNIRELINVIEYCVTMTNSEIISLNNLPKKIVNIKKKSGISSKKRKKIPKKEFLKLLEHYGNSTKEKKKLAKHLNISLATLYRWIKKYDKR